MKKLIVLSFLILLSCKSRDSYVKFIYLKDSPDDLSLLPQKSKDKSLWDYKFLADSIIIYNKEEIRNFKKAMSFNSNLKDTIYPDFSNAFIISADNKIDTIYSTYYLKFFCDSKVNREKKMIMSYEKIFEVYKSNDFVKKSLPRKIQKKYINFLKKEGIKYGEE